MDTVIESKKILSNNERQVEEMIDFAKNMGFLDNPNNFDFWFEKIKNKTDLRIPQTKIIHFHPILPAMIYDSGILQEQIDELDSMIKKELEDANFDTSNMFIKTGTYSGKYDFRDCHCSIDDNLFNKFYNISYDAAMVGAGVPPQMIVREFVPAKKNTPEIYHGMPLRHEYRVFVDFDNEKILGVVNYWHETEMCKLAKGNTLDEAKEKLACFKQNPYKCAEWEKESFEDFEVWLKWFESLDMQEVELEKKHILKNIDSLVKSHALKGRWSVDVMIEGSEYYLIDMAIAERSAMYNLVENEGK